MNVLHLIPFLITFVVGFIAIKEFGLSDEDILEMFYGKKDNRASERSIDDQKISKDIENPDPKTEYLSMDYEERSSTLKVYMSILNSVKLGESIPSRLLNNTEISKNKFSKLLHRLLDQGLISYVDKDIVIYQPPELNSKIIITDKGRGLLEYSSISKKLMNVRS